MRIKLIIIAILVLFSVPTAISAFNQGERYMVISSNPTLLKVLGSVRHDFGNVFTARLNSFQLKIAKLLGADIEPVPILYISGSVGDKYQDTGDNATLSSRLSRSFLDGPSEQVPWGIKRVYGGADISYTSGGEGISVAVLDTGIYRQHKDLRNAVIDCKDFSNPIFPKLIGRCSDGNGHGTHVAGIIAANGGRRKGGIYGVAPDAGLIIYKVCNDEGACYADDIAMGIIEASDAGANIINMSFGSDMKVPLIIDAIDYAFGNNVLVVAAAGNDGPFDGSIDYPAAYKNVVAVGAINSRDEVTKWSSRGMNELSAPYVVEEGDIEFAAPGEDIESTWPRNRYETLSGTSMACPFVSGLGAILWSENPGSNAEQVRDLLHKYSVDIMQAGDDNDSGFGVPSL